MNQEQEKRIAAEEWVKRIYFYLDPLQKLDNVKIVYTPLDLGIKICTHIPADAWSGKILVVSDLGLLCAVWDAMKKRGLDTKRVQFLCHLKKHKIFVEQKLNVKTTCVSYASLQKLFVKNSKMNYFGNVKFDVIVGNPPYQPNVENGKGAGSANKIWQKFVEKAFDLTTDEGHILFITPNNWRAGNFTKSIVREAQRRMWEEATILWYEDVKAHFEGVGVEIDAWHLKKGEHDTKLPQKAMRSAMVLPRDEMAIPVFSKFFTVCLREDCLLHLKTNDGRNFPYISDDKHQWRHAVTTAQTKKGQFHWYDHETPDYSKKKVIIGDAREIGAWYDPGTCGLSSSATGYEVENEEAGRMLIAFFESSLVSFIIKQMKLPDTFRTPVQLFRRLPKSILTTPWQEVFGFTDDELAIIEGKSHVSIKEAAE
jgi:hypothetical protein